MDESNIQPDDDAQATAGEAATDVGTRTDAAGSKAGESVAGVKAPAFEDLAEAVPVAGAHPSLDIVLDVPVTISLEVGKATMTVGELIRLGQGAVVELDRAVGEPLDVMVNGALVAHGEIVLVNEKFGIRLTSVVASAGEQMKEAS